MENNNDSGAYNLLDVREISLTGTMQDIVARLNFAIGEEIFKVRGNYIFINRIMLIESGDDDESYSITLTPSWERFGHVDYTPIHRIGYQIFERTGFQFDFDGLDSDETVMYISRAKPREYWKKQYQ